MLKMFSMVVVIFLTAIPLAAYAGYSHGPRQIGEVVLDELLMGSNKFFIRVGSGGCTVKGSFKVDVKKEEGLTPKAPHYVLTIKRIKVDECKAIVDNGTLILFDMEKDLGIRGDFIYSLTNPVYSSFRIQPTDESFLSIIGNRLNWLNK